MRVGLSAGLDPTQENKHVSTGHGLQKPALPALAVKWLEAKKA